MQMRCEADADADAVLMRTTTSADDESYCTVTKSFWQMGEDMHSILSPNMHACIVHLRRSGSPAGLEENWVTGESGPA